MPWFLIPGAAYPHDIGELSIGDGCDFRISRTRQPSPFVETHAGLSGFRGCQTYGSRKRLVCNSSWITIIDHSLESTKQKSGTTISVNMEELIGNTHGFAESGFVILQGPVSNDGLNLCFSVSSAVVQRYLPQILDCALSSHAQIQNSAVDILSHTIKQGLAHPIMVSANPVAYHAMNIQCLFVVIPDNCSSGDFSSQCPKYTRRRSPHGSTPQTCFIIDVGLHPRLSQVV